MKSDDWWDREGFKNGVEVGIGAWDPAVRFREDLNLVKYWKFYFFAAVIGERVSSLNRVHVYVFAALLMCCHLACFLNHRIILLFGVLNFILDMGWVSGVTSSWEFTTVVCYLFYNSMYLNNI